MNSIFLNTLLEGQDLNQNQAEKLMHSIMAGEVPASQLAGLLVALRIKGETVNEITGFARAMRSCSIEIAPSRTGLVDTCGTGGDACGTFNISTAAALVAAAMGIPVAKHGNRAVSSQCGSADVLEALGVNIDLQPEQVALLIDQVGIGFLFAPVLHPAMRHAGPVRRELSVRTVFNILGPLTNPAGVKKQLLGVFASRLCEPMCHVLNQLGSEQAYVVHGIDGLDEVSPTGETIISSLQDNQIETFSFYPEEAGLARCSMVDLAGGSAHENAECILSIFAGKPGPQADAVLLNAGFTAVLGGQATDIKAGVELARETINSGEASLLLKNLVAASAELSKEAS